MTIIEVAIQELESFGLDESKIKYELEKNGLTPSTEVTNIGELTSSKEFELMKAGMILNIILTEAESWVQGDMNEKRNFDALKAYVSSIYRKYGLIDPFADQSKIATIRRL